MEGQGQEIKTCCKTNGENEARGDGNYKKGEV